MQRTDVGHGGMDIAVDAAGFEEGHAQAFLDFVSGDDSGSPEPGPTEPRRAPGVPITLLFREGSEPCHSWRQAEQHPPHRFQAGLQAQRDMLPGDVDIPKAPLQPTALVHRYAARRLVGQVHRLDRALRCVAGRQLHRGARAQRDRTARHGVVPHAAQLAEQVGATRAQRRLGARQVCLSERSVAQHRPHTGGPLRRPDRHQLVDSGAGDASVTVATPLTKVLVIGIAYSGPGRRGGGWKSTSGTV